jgi:hypothetical protein
VLDPGPASGEGFQDTLLPDFDSSWAYESFGGV